jgi:hypothetical protein
MSDHPLKLSPGYDELKAQRDELLAALCVVRAYLGSNVFDGVRITLKRALDIADEAIARAEAK